MHPPAARHIMSFILVAVAAVTIVSLGGTAIYATVGTAQNTANKEPAHKRIPLDALQGLANPYEAAVAELTVINGDLISTCSASHVGPTGQVLTAVHCLQEPFICDYNTNVREYPLTTGTLTVDVAGVNGTSGEKWSFPATVLGWSGIHDVMVLQLQPLVKADSSVIMLASQPFLSWGSNRKLQRAEPVRALTFDLAFLKKLGRSGPVLHPYADRGSGFAVSTEQVFADVNALEGASGSAMLDANMEIVMAPLTYGWISNNDVFAVSGTSADVSGPLVRAILAGALPNGPAHNKFLVPTLGIVPILVPSAATLPPDYYGTLENKGVVFFWLATQNYYEFLVTMYGCGFPPYNLTPPSLLGAPLTHTSYGNPPALFPEFPAFDDGTVVLLMAIERAHYTGQWVYVGEDGGLETVSGVLATSGYGVGDWVQVRVLSTNPYALDNPDAVWEGIYNVTLQPIDPFWDTIQMDPFMNLARYVRVNQTQPGSSTTLHYDSFMVKNKLLVGKRPLNAHGRGRPQSSDHYRSNVSKNPNLSLSPAGSDIDALPTLAELYLNVSGKSSLFASP